MTKMLRRVAKNKNSEGKKCAQKSRKSRAALSARSVVLAYNNPILLSAVSADLPSA